MRMVGHVVAKLVEAVGDGTATSPRSCIKAARRMVATASLSRTIRRAMRSARSATLRE
jgi:hypothetical protein